MADSPVPDPFAGSDPVVTSPTVTAAEAGKVPASTGGEVALERIIGRIPVVLVFVEPPDDAVGHEVLRSLGEHLADFGRDRIQLLAVARRPVEGDQGVTAVEDDVEGNARILADPDGTLAARVGADYLPGRSTTVLIDATGAVAAVWHDRAAGTIAETILERLGHLGG
jgi:peroxiredoxin